LICLTLIFPEPSGKSTHFRLQGRRYLEVSGKTGEGVDKLLESIVKIIPPPKGELEKPLRAAYF